MTVQVIIPYKPRDAFKPYHARTQRWAVNVCHRRAGKSVAAINDLQRDVLRCPLERPRAYYVAPTFAQAKKVVWDYAKHYAGTIPGIRFNETELRIDYPTGGRLQLVGAENVDGLRGIYADAVVLDEFAFMSAEVWQKIIRPALSDRNGRATFISSVNGRNELYKLEKLAKERPDEWFTMNLKASESGIIPEHEMSALKAEMSAEDYAQEYENSFDVATKGSYYGALISKAETEGRITSVPYDGAALVTSSWDLGIGDATAIWFWQAVGKEVHAIDYYENSGKALSHYAEVIQGRGYAYGEHILPHDAEARELGTGKTRVEMLRELGIKATIAPALTVDDGIAALRVLLPRVWFDAKRCAEGVDKLRQYRAQYDEKRQVLSDRPLHDSTSHCADAARYYAVGRKEKRPERPRRVNLGWVA